MRKTDDTDGQSWLQMVNFVVMPDTYFIDHALIKPGDTVTGFYDTSFYDTSLPVPMVYPPQYQAVVMAKATQDRQVTVDWFGPGLVSSEGDLNLNIGPKILVHAVACRPIVYVQSLHDLHFDAENKIKSS